MVLAIGLKRVECHSSKKTFCPEKNISNNCKKVKVAVNRYGVIGKRVADAVQLQEDMELVGICDVISDWRIKKALRKDYPISAFDIRFQKQMSENEIEIKGTLGDLIRVSDIIIDCTPKKIAAQNIQGTNKVQILGKQTNIIRRIMIV